MGKDQLVDKNKAETNLYKLLSGLQQQKFWGRVVVEMHNGTFIHVTIEIKSPVDKLSKENLINLKGIFK